MRITFLGAAKTVTGSKYLLQAAGKRILVDCGLYQGYKDLRQRNWSALPIDAKSIDCVILTHAHIDHSGYLPLLVKNGFSGKIYCSNGTFDLCSILLPDCGYLEEEDARRANKYGYTKHKPALPLYTRADALESLNQFTPVQFQHDITLAEHLSFKLIPSGHIIGSSFIELTFNNKKIIFSGDLGRPQHPIMKPPTRHLETDYLVIESTYGDRRHDNSDPAQQILNVIQRTIARGGSIIIPAFAVGRTQDMLYFLHQLKSRKEIPDIPVYLDSPMAQSVSDLLIKYIGEHNLDLQTCKSICSHVTYVKTQDESKAIEHLGYPVIILSASGMATGGRILHHLKHFLPDNRSTILFTGYQDPGTRGDRIVSGEKRIRIHGEMIGVNAEIVTMDNLSAHADYVEILSWIASFAKKPKRIFITHGNQASAVSLKQKIEKELKIKCVIPDYAYSETLS